MEIEISGFSCIYGIYGFPAGKCAATGTKCEMLKQNHRSLAWLGAVVT
jgi:hypothetical protein